MVAGIVAEWPEPVDALGVGIAGLVDVDEGLLTWMPHHSGWPRPMRDELESALGCRVVVDNDANMAALAEGRRGAGEGHRFVLTVTVGTGIGAGLTIGGRVERGRGFLGEVGHMVVDGSGPRCSCGLRGCWEAVASGTALDRAARALAEADPRRALASVETATGRDLAEAAARGNRDAAAGIDRVGVAFGRGLAALATILDPDLIVVGGGVAVGLGERLLTPARRAMIDLLPGAGHKPKTPVVEAEFGVECRIDGSCHRGRGVDMSERRWWEIAGAAVVPAGKLVARLARDPRVPQRTRWFAAGAAAYALLPFDLIPDRIPLIGKFDDLGAIMLGLVRLVEDAGEEVIAEHWDGGPEELEAFLAFVSSAGELVPRRVRRIAGLVGA